MIDDNQCIRSIALGDPEALKELYQHFGDRVYNTILSYLKNEEDAQEVLQDVFVTVHHTAGKFQFNSSVSTWIYRIAVNKSLDFIRSKHAKKRQGIFTSIYKKDSGEILYDSPNFEHPGVVLEKKEHAKFLFKAIDALSENQRTAFILTQVEGISQNEVAEIMDLTRKSVESLIQRAKANLRIELKKYYPERGK
ncbi:MAG: RNA polymerase sigma factor [Ekhidna sp.]